MKIFSATLFAIFLIGEASFADNSFYSHVLSKFDSVELQQVVALAPAGNCTDPQYVEQVKFFLASSVDFYNFIPALNGAFSWQQYQATKGETPFTVKLSTCFVEALFSAVLPDVLKVEKSFKDNEKFKIKIISEVTNEGDSLKDKKDLYAFSTVKRAAYAYSLLAFSQIRTCDFQQDPLVFLSGTSKLQSFLDFIYGGTWLMVFVRGDECALNFHKANRWHYLDILKQKVNQTWMQP